MAELASAPAVDEPSSSLLSASHHGTAERTRSSAVAVSTSSTLRRPDDLAAGGCSTRQWGFVHGPMRYLWCSMHAGIQLRQPEALSRRTSAAAGARRSNGDAGLDSDLVGVGLTLTWTVFLA